MKNIKTAPPATQGKASVWVESEVQHIVDCWIADARGEDHPPPPKDKPQRLVRYPEVERMTGLKRGHLSWLIRENRFPAPLKLPAARTESAAA